VTIERFIVTLLRWLGFDKEPDEGRRRFMLGLVFTAATVQFGIALPSAPKPPRTATLSSITDILKQLYPQEAVKEMLYDDSPMLQLWRRA
jgi:hypothetical protein